MPRLPHSTSNQPHLGCGVSFPLQIDARGNLQFSAGEQSVRESIGLILGTQLGERVYRANFGCRLADLAFAPLNTQTLLTMRLHVEEALIAWEPRILLDAVRTEPDPVRGRVNILINYRLRENYAAGSLVYPFYLQADGDR
ncbi:MAG: GPW/gp25 family protein [Spirulinaceae cyanobacterium RM2_2_10]|nr:GPW/gp25 family protein [Spirulinaceae cyanobacterium SM2_1_0]NJO19418.1 GPW/gp25 family protein [Spirulinaceae cyanobacterium RM2_2_10]